MENPHGGHREGYLKTNCTEIIATMNLSVREKLDAQQALDEYYDRTAQRDWDSCKAAIAQYISEFGWPDIRDLVQSLKPKSDASLWDDPTYQPGSVEWQRSEIVEF